MSPIVVFIVLVVYSVILYGIITTIKKKNYTNIKLSNTDVSIKKATENKIKIVNMPK